jgi:uncharacterized membrane protein HdeD (DUF308 family)
LKRKSEITLVIQIKHIAMSPKYYEKSWLQAFKGGFLIILGIFSMLQIAGSIKSLAMIFSFFIGMTGFVLIVAPIILKKGKLLSWNFMSGVLHVVFALILIFIADYPREQIVWVLLVWVIFNAVTEIIEALILLNEKNSFSGIFIINALLSLLLGYGLYLILIEITTEKLFNIGLIAVVFGLINELSAFMLSSVKKSE